MNMRPSRVLKKLRAGQNVVCVKFNLSDPRAVELASMCGIDCSWLDMEHTLTDWVTVENQIRAAKIHDVDTMVRVARGSYSNYIQPLEADAAGIMVPHVMSYEDAKKVVWQTRFHPLGRRAIDGGNQDGAYCMIDFKEYLKTANEQRFVAIQIEDPEPLDELDKIASVEGIDMLFFGPGDFSHGIGAPGQWDHPKITETRKRVVQVARNHGKFAGTVGSAANFEELAAMGYQFINVGADVVGLTNYFKDIIDIISKIESNRSSGSNKKG